MALLIWGALVTAAALYFFVMNLLNTVWIRSHTCRDLVTTGPKVSVLIPARNEENNIEACVRSFFCQSYDNYEICVLDDNSDDATYDILQRLQQEQPERLRIMKGKPLESGWNGKPYAMRQLTEAAQGEIFLCTDADTVHTADSVAWAVTQMRHLNADMISGYVHEQLETFGEKITVPVMFLLTSLVLPIFISRHTKSVATAAAIGQYIVLRASSFHEAGGYDVIRNKASEDMYMARNMKKKQFLPLFLDAKQVASCRMYEGYAKSLKGLSKNIADFFGNNVFAVSLVAVAIIAGLLAPLPAGIVLCCLGHMDAVLLLIGALLYFAVWICVCLDRAIPLYIAFLYPLLFWNLLVLVVCSGARTYKKTGFEWKGRIVY